MSDRREALLEAVASDLDRLMCARSLTQRAVWRAMGGRGKERTLSRILRAHDCRLSTLVEIGAALGVSVEVRFRIEP